MTPGRTLHRIAACICSADSLHRIVEPAIADLQKEYAGAGRATRRIWVLLAGYLAILKVVALCARSARTTDEERRAIANALTWAIAMFVLVFALLILPPLYGDGHQTGGWYSVLTLVPQALPLAIPIGVAFGIAFGLSARPTMSITKVVLMFALTASVASFGILAWAMPAANEAFRAITLRELTAKGYQGPVSGLQKEHSEMTLAELRSEHARLVSEGEPQRARQLSFSFHLRFALALATLALAAVLLAAPFTHRRSRGLIAFAASFGYLVLAYTGEALSVSYTALPPAAAAWLPNVAMIGFAMVVASSRSSGLRGSSRRSA